MRAILQTIGAAFVAGVALATALYALFVGVFVANTPGLLGRGRFAVRVAIVFLACAVGVWIAWRVVRKTAVPLAWIAAPLLALAVGVPFFTLYLYPIWSHTPDEREQQQLRAIAAAVSEGDHGKLTLPQGYSYAIVCGAKNDAQRLTIHASDRVVARVIGIDMSRLDNVAVEVDRDGRVKRAWVDYF